MKILYILILLFLLSAFSIGVGLSDSNRDIMDSSLDNVSLIIENINLNVPDDSEITNAKGIYKIIESGIKFVGVLGLETMRTGIYFGQDNPQYFTPEFIIKIIKLIYIISSFFLLPIKSY